MWDVELKKWKLGSILFFIIGTGFAISLTFLSSSPVHNESLLYIFICGIVGVSGMLIPGLSGSFILILMGTYELLMIESLSNPINNMVILSVFILGIYCWTYFILSCNCMVVKIFLKIISLPCSQVLF